MTKPVFAIFAISSLLALVGCGQSATNEPMRLDKVFAEEQPEPLPTAKPVAETALHSEAEPVHVEPIEQAAFTEESPTAEAESTEPATVPPVLLSSEHAALSRVKVGDAMPEIELPKIQGGIAKLSALYGKAATVVVFWKGDRQMALDELADLGPDVVQNFGSRGVDVIGVAVAEPAAEARSVIQTTKADFSQLLDADGKAFDKVGSQKFPWTLVLDANGKIVWFDLEYSLATRRELQQALLATVR